jgi:sec-independent protein translocase protein TatA
MGLENPIHILVIALVIVLLFGAKRLPELGRQLGRGIREVKDHTGLDEITSAPKEIRAAITQPAAKPAATVATSATTEPADKPETAAS